MESQMFPERSLPIQLQGPGTIEPDCTGHITYRQTIAGQPAPDITVGLVVFDGGDVIKSMSLGSTGVRGFEATAMRARWPEERMVPAHFSEAGDDSGHRVGG